MNWKQLAKTIVDEIKAWAAERFAEVGQVRALVAAEVRELQDAHADLKKQHAALATQWARQTVAPPKEAITAAVAAWFEANPPPVPKDGTSVEFADLQPYLQSGLANWQLEFERQAGATLQRFLDKLPTPKDGRPGADPTDEQIAAAVGAYFAAHPVPTEKGAKGDPGPAPSGDALDAAVAHYFRQHPVPPPLAPSEEALAAAVKDWVSAHPLSIPDPAALAGRALEAAEAAVAAYLEGAAREEVQDALGRMAIAAEALDLKAVEVAREAVAAWTKAQPPPPAPSAEDVAAAVAVYLKAHPPADGQDGTSVSLEDVQPLLDQAFNGWALEFERRASDVLERAVARMPAPKDGRDGLDVSNLSVELDEDCRTVRFVLADGERRHVATCRLPIPLDRGVFRDGAAYERADCVTFGGSLWMAQKDGPTGRPGTSPDWRLAVKHGRDAKPPRPVP